MTAVETSACPWCGERFERRRDGGKEQRFCRLPCRRAYDAAGRRWIAAALASGVLSLDELRNGAPTTTRALLAAAGSPAALRFIVEVEPTIVDGLVRLGFIGPDERDELGAIIAGMKRLGWAPRVSRLA
jgi:hypothetical protein